MGLQHRVQEPRERASLCGCKYSILCLCPDQGTNKEQRCQRNKELGAPRAYTRSGTWQPRGHQDHLNTTGNITVEAILHPQLPEFGTMAPWSVQAGRGTVKNQAVGRGILKEEGGRLNISMTMTTTTTTGLEIQYSCSCENVNYTCVKLFTRLSMEHKSSWLKSQINCS